MINIADYKIRVYIDSIEGWQEIDQINFKQVNEFRAIVTTKNDTTVRRILKIVENEACIKPDRCVYLIKKPKFTLG